MTDKKPMFVPVGKNIFDLNVITNIAYSTETIQVYIKNNPNGVQITVNEYEQLIHYLFGGENTLSTEMIPQHVLVGKNMFNTDMITHVLYNNGKVLVYINNNPTGMTITDD